MNRPLSLNRWLYVEGNPVNLVDPSGLFAITDISASFGMSDTYDLGNLFYPGGHLAGKWGYLKFLLDANFYGKHTLWRETGYSDPAGITNFSSHSYNIERFYRPNVTSNLCPEMNWFERPGNGCYADGEMISAGHFEIKNNRIIWIDIISGRQMSLLNLGHINVDWYGVANTGKYYAYEPYSISGYDWSKVDKLSLAANGSGLALACAIALCPLTEGATCAAIPFLTVSTVSLGVVSTVSDINQAELNNPDTLIGLSLDYCSMAPKYQISGVCSTIGLGRTLKKGNVIIK